MYLSTIFIFSSGFSHGHSKRKMTFRLFFSCIYKNKTYRSECPANHQAIAKVQFEIFYIHVILSMYLSTKSYLFKWFISRELKTGTWFFCYFSLAYSWKKRTSSSARSASTGNLQIASPKSWWFCQYCRWQFVFHRGSTPQTRLWKCKKSVDESTEVERLKIQAKK